MTIQKLSALTAVLVTSICSLAHADPFYEGTVTNADHGFILSAEGGYGVLLNTPNKQMNGSTGSASVGEMVWGANLGYAWPIDAISAIGIEIGYADNGQSKYTGGGGVNDTGTLKITSVDGQILGSFNSTWDSGINLFFKAGAAVLYQKAKLSNRVDINGTTVAPFSNNKYYLEPMVVIGMGYKVTPSVNIYLEGSGIMGNYHKQWSDVGTSPSNINAASAVLAAKAGISYAFSE